MIWRKENHFQKGEYTIVMDYNAETDASGYPPYRVQKWGADELIFVKTFKGELGQMNAQRTFNDLVSGMVYA